MTRALVVYCHPQEGSFAAAVRKVVVSRLRAAQSEIRVRDLYAEGFQPLLTQAEWSGYLDAPANRAPVESHVADLEWCDTLIFIYPTWWYGLPAMLKGWLDRVWTPGVAFTLPKDGPIAPALTHIRKLGVVTTCGASWWLTQVVGAPGRNLILRGCGFLMAPRCRKVYLAHYRMDASTPQSREKFRARVARAMARF